ncbi:MAG: HDOD domain-containing protein [Leptothrix sp. (in: b-proteobacteria)]
MPARPERPADAAAASPEAVGSVTEERSAALQELLDRIAQQPDFPSLRSSVMAIQRVAHNDHSRVHALAAEIAKDVGASSRVLRLVNTAFYRSAGAGEISSISRAISLLGFRSVAEMTLTLRLIDQLGVGPGQRVRMEMLRTLLAGLLARELHPQIKHEEEAYLAALFQNLGRLLVELHLPEQARQVREAQQADDDWFCAPAEQQASGAVLGQSFSELSVDIARLWGWAPDLREGLRWLPPGPGAARTPVQQLRVVSSVGNDLATLVLSQPQDRWDSACERLLQLRPDHPWLDKNDLRRALTQAQLGLADLARLVGVSMGQALQYGSEASGGPPQSSGRATSASVQAPASAAASDGPQRNAGTESPQRWLYVPAPSAAALKPDSSDAPAPAIGPAAPPPAEASATDAADQTPAETAGLPEGDPEISDGADELTTVAPNPPDEVEAVAALEPGKSADPPNAPPDEARPTAPGVRVAPHASEVAAAAAAAAASVTVRPPTPSTAAEPAPVAPAAPAMPDRLDILAQGLQDTSLALLEGEPMPQLLRRVLDILWRGLQARHAVLCLREPLLARLRPALALGLVESLSPLCFQIELQAAGELFAVVCQRGADLLISDAAQPGVASRLPHWHRQRLSSGSFLVLPMQARQRPVGMIYLDCNEPGRLQCHEREMQLVRALRNQALLALQLGVVGRRS